MAITHDDSFTRRVAAPLLLAAMLVAAPGLADEKLGPPSVVRMPPWCNTPDGMTLMDDGTVLLSCPNFNDTAYPGVIMKLDRDNTLSIFFPCTVHPGTKRGCPMGLDVGPDGHVYYADNQSFSDKNHASRLMRVVMEKGRPVRGEVAVEGLKLANAVAWHGDAVYVSDTFLDIEGKPGMSGVYRFTLDELARGTVKVTPGLGDRHLLATFQTKTNPRNEMAGADGVTLDTAGRLYTGNFGDGVFSRVTIAADGTAKEQSVVSTAISCVDGIFYDAARDRIFIADSEKNAVQVFNPATGQMTTLWENDDSDGADGSLDQPCEVLVRGDDLIVANFDMPFPGMKNKVFDKAHTLSIFRLAPAP
ncbi:MAG: SMP-30/gluconolactonase/LRE family protein [Planctomycetia bacterium]